MRRIYTILSLHLKEFFRSPSVLVLMFVMPILFSFIFGGMAFNAEKHKPLVNVVVSGGEVELEVLRLFEKNEQYEWKSVSEQQAKQNVAKQDAVAAVVIPINIQQRLIAQEPIFDIIVQRKNEDFLALIPHIEGTARTIFNSYQAVKMMEEEPFPALLEMVAASKGVTFEKEIIKKESNNETEINLMFVGFTIMFMMFGLSGAASTILAERTGGTWSRLMISPTRKHEIALGYLLAYFLMGWLQFAVLMTTMSLLFQTNWGKFVYLIPFGSLVILTIVGFGLMMAGLVKTQQQATALSTILIVSTCMLGGVYWSIDFVPEIMQKISLAVPQSWAMSGFKEIISGSLHTKTLIQDTFALLGFTTVFFFIALKRIKFE